MSSVTSFFAGMVLGAAGAALGMNYYWQKRSRDIEQKAVDSCRKAFNRPNPTYKKKAEEEKKDIPESKVEKSSIKPAPVRKEVKPSAAAEEMKQITKRYDPVKVEEDDIVGGRYIIAPFEFGSRDYEERSIEYYAGDKKFVDENMHVLTAKEVEETFGADCVEHFGEYEEDVVYVRNDDRGYDYEIVRAAGRYFNPSHPYDPSDEEE